MFCKHCGYEIDNQTTFCPKCGKRIEEEIVFTAENTENEIIKDKKSNLSGSILGFGITSIVFSLFSFVFWFVGTVEAIAFGKNVLDLLIVAISFPILGWIFASIARRNARNFEEQFGETEGRATVGKHLALPALIICIVITCMLAILIFGVL